MDQRRSGILLHITSLPSRFGIGDLGPEAYHFLDFLAQTGQTYWQVLPLNPTLLFHGDCPYTSISPFAGNPLVISPELLADNGLLLPEELTEWAVTDEGGIDYSRVHECKKELLTIAFRRFMEREGRDELDAFLTANQDWLQDYLRFKVLKDLHEGIPWWKWPEGLKQRETGELERIDREHREMMDYEAFLQYTFFRQWSSLKEACNERGIKIIGDLPIYVDLDSTDVWSNSELFKLDEEGKPAVVAGVPPDYFSKTGQRWGNPVYDWEFHGQTGYTWWIDRVKHNLGLFDIVRLDHFRGFASFWEIPASESTAVNGTWVEGPGRGLFDALKSSIPALPIIAEDLGVITPDVIELKEHYDLPGMKILLFAFDQSLPNNAYAPHNIIPECILYTGTHDNNTARGWFLNETSPEDKKRISDYFGHKITANNIHLVLCHAAMTSVANSVILPVQDLLGLGKEARMNVPGVGEGNWAWRLKPGEPDQEITEKLKRLTELTARLNPDTGMNPQ